MFSCVPDQDPQCEFLTYETIQTYRGHKPDRTIVIKERHDMVESEAQKSPCAQHFLRSNTSSAAETSTCTSTENLATDRKVTFQKEKTPETSQPKSRASSASGKASLTPPASTTTTPQRVRRSQSLSAKRTVSAFGEFEKACLKAHNDFRLKHAVPPLKLSKRLCRFAEEWAKVSID